MRRRIAFLGLLVTVLLTLGWVAAGPALAGDPCYHSTDRPATSAGATVAITIRDCDFSPTVTSVPVGSTVTWTNRSFQPHEIVGSNLTWGAHEKLVDANGGTIGWTFDKPGVYAYTCMLHPGMSGAIVVGSPDLDLASDVEAATATEPASTDADSTLIPALATGGIGLALGLLVGGAFMARRKDSTSV